MKTKKCVECGTAHHNTDVASGGIQDRCFNCFLVVEMLDQFVKAMNLYTPKIGKPRRLKIIKYKISK